LDEESKAGCIDKSQDLMTKVLEASEALIFEINRLLGQENPTAEQQP
jgi:hypothetical protein